MKTSIVKLINESKFISFSKETKISIKGFGKISLKSERTCYLRLAIFKKRQYSEKNDFFPLRLSVFHLLLKRFYSIKIPLKYNGHNKIVLIVLWIFSTTVFIALEMQQKYD